RAPHVHNKSLPLGATACSSVQHAKPAMTGRFPRKRWSAPYRETRCADFPQGTIHDRETAGHSLSLGSEERLCTTSAPQRSPRSRLPPEAISPCFGGAA